MTTEQDFQIWQSRVAGTNISASTLLATDYLNHFNEIIMLLGMVAEMPELLDECRAWRPMSYIEHFKGSGFPDRDLALAAYDHVPPRFRLPFEETVERMNRQVALAIAGIDAALALGERAPVGLRAAQAVATLQQLQDITAAIIHGSEAWMNQGQIDRLVEEDKA